MDTTPKPAPDSLPDPNPDYKAPTLEPVSSADYLATDQSFENGTKRLSIPANKAALAVPKNSALNPVDGNGTPLSFDKSHPYTVSLAEYSDDVMASVDPKTGQRTILYSNRLAWAVIYHSIPASDMPSSGPVQPAGSENAQSGSGAARYTSVQIVDAVTGRALVGFVVPES